MNGKNISLAVMILFYLAAGANHFRNPAAYHPLIPHFLGDAARINILAGISEIVLALGLVFSATRKWAAYGVVIMLFAFIPSHILMITKGGCFPKPSICVPVWVMWVRLLVLQPVLIWWALNVKNAPGGFKKKV